ncbi:Hydroxyproline-rich glycoprotein family protein [Quillaja saponaria]|uniref:Hydroxyproline-rich glycoprotein family protein n=1 Tax=Quillaja saponaria TaxID=32244 RepID=A0AAD7PZI8_QUISA|nr:Hydroxyproline-rich glycoprotein family protein [Quillaja saponaria]
MGKAEEELYLPSSQNSEQNVDARCGCRCAKIRKLIGLKCIFVLLLSVAVFLSAIFWLPPFLQFADQRDLDPDPDSLYKDHDIVASFIVRKPVSLVEDNILQLADDIFEEVAVRYTKVVILSLESISEPNLTKVVFGFDPDGKYSEMSSAAESLIRSYFKYLVVGQLPLRLTTPLFGEPSFFQVLKFKGGITIIPPQNAFLLQKVQLQFNFTLNNSIYQIQTNFNELTSQLKSGLHLAPYENLYVILSNYKGSTVNAPTIVQSSVLLAIGNTLSMQQRLKQLAQTITGSHSRNLGLNNTVFGPAVSPGPMPLTLRGATPPEDGSPAAAKSAPAPRKSYQAQPPNCQYGHRSRSKEKARKEPQLTPTVAPYSDPQVPQYPAASPQRQVDPPAHASYSIPASSPLPNVVFAHVDPPSKSEPVAGHSDRRFLGPSPSPSSAGHSPTVKWAFPLFLVLVLHL